MKEITLYLMFNNANALLKEKTTKPEKAVFVTLRDERNLNSLVIRGTLLGLLSPYKYHTQVFYFSISKYL